MQIQTTNAVRVLVRRAGRTQSTWALIADGANTVAVNSNVFQYRAGDILPVSWRGNDLVIGSAAYHVVTRLPDGAYVVEAVAGGR